MTTAVFPASGLTPQNWAARYEQQLVAKFVWAIEFVQANPAAEVRSHFSSLLTLLERSWQRPFLHPLAADLIAALHPLPYRWGHWQEWLYISRQSVDLFAALARPLPQAEILAGIIDILFELGRHDDACRVFAEIWAIPGAAAVIRPLVRAGHRVSTRLLLAGRDVEGIAFYERQLDLFNEIQAELQQQDRVYADSYLVLQKTLIMRRQGRQREAVLAIEAVIASLAKWPETPLDLQREVHHHHGGIRLGTCEFVLCAAAMEQAIHCAVQMDDPFAEASLYIDKTIPLWCLGQFDEVETAVRRGLYLCEKLNANWQVLIGIGILIDVFVVRGEFTEALSWGTHLITLAQQLGFETEAQHAKTVNGITLLHLGEIEQGRILLEECLHSYQEKHSLRWQSLVKSNLSFYWAFVGDTAKGHQFAKEALIHAQEVQAVNVIVLALCILARFQTGQVKKDSLMRALTMAREHHMLYSSASALFLLAACSEDETEQARYWQEAVDLMQMMGIEKWLNGRFPQNPPHLPLIA